MSDEDAAASLSDEDCAKLREWYKDICGQESEEGFREFLSSNGRILGRFFNLKGTNDQAKLQYFFKVYMHQAAGDRADSENWYWRLAFLVGLMGLAVVFLVEFLVRAQASEWDPVTWFLFILFLAYSGISFLIGLWGNEIYKLLKKLKKGGPQ